LFAGIDYTMLSLICTLAIRGKASAVLPAPLSRSLTGLLHKHLSIRSVGAVRWSTNVANIVSPDVRKTGIKAATTAAATRQKQVPKENVGNRARTHTGTKGLQDRNNFDEYSQYIYERTHRIAELPPYLADVSEKLLSGSSPMSSSELARTMSILQSVSPETPGFLKLVDAIIAKAIVCGTGFTGTDATTYVNSFSCLRLDGPHVMELLSVLLSNLKHYKPELDGIAICNILFGLRGMSSEKVEVRAFLQFLGEQLATITSNPLSMNHIGPALYGLQNMSGHHAEVRNILSSLKVIMSHPHSVFDAASVACSLCSLRAMRRRSKESTEIIDILTSKLPGRLLSSGLATPTRRQASAKLPALSSCSSKQLKLAELPAKQIGLTLNEIIPGPNITANVQSNFHLRPTHFRNNYDGFSLYRYERIGRIADLLPYLDDIAERMISQSSQMLFRELAQTMYGIKSIPPETPGLLKLVDVIIAKTKVCHCRLTVSDVIMYLNGLSCLRFDGPHLRELLSVLLPHLKNSERALNGSTLCNILFELRGMSSESVEVRALLQFVGEKLAQMEFRRLPSELSDVSGPAVYVLQSMYQKQVAIRNLLPSDLMGQALYGLQNMSHEHVEVRNVLRTLRTLLSQPNGISDAAFTSSSLCILRAMNPGSHDVSEMIDMLSSKLPCSRHSWNGYC
jgi:hypothetical protein